MKLVFAYDYLGRRIQKQIFVPSNAGSATATVKYIWDGWNCVGSKTTAGTTTTQTYIWGPDLSGTLQGAGGVGGLLFIQSDGGSTADDNHFVSMDANGNVLALVNGDGDVTAQYEYGPFGELLRATGTFAADNPFRFSTKYTDKESGLVYYGYRYYDPVEGRWLSRDPIGERGGLNLYGFVGNNGVNRVDYLGQKEVTFREYMKLRDQKPFKDKYKTWVLFYEAWDPMFKEWANSVASKISDEQLKSASVFGNDISTEYRSECDFIVKIPVSDFSAVRKLLKINKVKYFASFGHGGGSNIYFNRGMGGMSTAAAPWVEGSLESRARSRCVNPSQWTIPDQDRTSLVFSLPQAPRGTRAGSAYYTLDSFRGIDFGEGALAELYHCCTGSVRPYLESLWGVPVYGTGRGIGSGDVGAALFEWFGIGGRVPEPDKPIGGSCKYGPHKPHATLDIRMDTGP